MKEPNRIGKICPNVCFESMKVCCLHTQPKDDGQHHNTTRHESSPSDRKNPSQCRPMPLRMPASEGRRPEAAVTGLSSVGARGNVPQYEDGGRGCRRGFYRETQVVQSENQHDVALNATHNEAGRVPPTPPLR